MKFREGPVGHPPRNRKVQMPRLQRTPETLRAASEHLFYEFSMFNTLAQAMASGVFGQGALINAVLESFTMHARVLLDFLYSENPKEDDVIAVDYFDNSSQWLKIRPEKTEILRTIHKRVGKEVAHVTYARLGVSLEAKQWPFTQIANDMNSVFHVFLGHVAHDHLGQSWAFVTRKPKS